MKMKSETTETAQWLMLCCLILNSLCIPSPLNEVHFQQTLFSNKYFTSTLFLQLPLTVRQWVQCNSLWCNIYPLHYFRAPSDVSDGGIFWSVQVSKLTYLWCLLSAKRAHIYWLWLGMFLFPDCQLVSTGAKRKNFT